MRKILGKINLHKVGEFVYRVRVSHNKADTLIYSLSENIQFLIKSVF